jgi:hypothetical protein
MSLSMRSRSRLDPLKDANLSCSFFHRIFIGNSLRSDKACGLIWSAALSFRLEFVLAAFQETG